MANYLDYGVDSNTGKPRGSLAAAVDMSADPEMAAYARMSGTPDLSRLAIGVPRTVSKTGAFDPITGKYTGDIGAKIVAPPPPMVDPDEVERALNAKPRIVDEAKLRRAHTKLGKAQKQVAKAEEEVAKLDENGEPIPTFTNSKSDTGPAPTFTAPPGPAAPLGSEDVNGMLAKAKPPEPPPPSDGMTPVEAKKTSVHMEPTEGYKAAIAEREGLGARQKALEEQNRGIEHERAQASLAMYDELEKGQAKLNDQYAKIDQQAAAQVTEAKRKTAEVVDQLAKEKSYKGLLGEMGGGSKILMAIGLALGGIGQGLAGGRNQAYDALMNRVQQDFEMHRAKIADMKDEVVIRQTGINDAQAARDRLADQNTVNHQALLTKVKATLEKQMAQQGMKAADIAADQKILDVDMKINAMTAADEAQMATKVQDEVERKKLFAKGVARENVTGLVARLATPIRDDAQYKDLAEINKQSTSYAQAQRLLASAVKTDNPKALQASMTEVMRVVNGGVLSDAERAQMVNSSGGFLQRLKDGSLMFSEGMVSPQTVRNFAGVIADRRRESFQTAKQLHDQLTERWGSPINPSTGRPMIPPEVLAAVIPKPYTDAPTQAAAPAGQVGTFTLKDGRKVRGRKNPDGSIDIIEGG